TRLVSKIAAPAPSNVVAFKPKGKAEAKADRQKAMEAITHEVPGLVGNLITWIEASAPNPNRILALASSLAFVGTLAGRNYASPTDLRTNIYTVGLAPSGFGK